MELTVKFLSAIILASMDSAMVQILVNALPILPELIAKLLFAPHLAKTWELVKKALTELIFAIVPMLLDGLELPVPFHNVPLLVNTAEDALDQINVTAEELDMQESNAKMKSTNALELLDPARQCQLAPTPQEIILAAHAPPDTMVPVMDSPLDVSTSMNVNSVTAILSQTAQIQWVTTRALPALPDTLELPELVA